MDAERIEDIAGWIDDHRGFLEAREAENTVLIGALLRLARRQDQEGFAYAVADGAGAVQMLVTCQPPHPPVLSNGPPEALNALCRRLTADEVAVTGVMAPEALAEAFLARCCPDRPARLLHAMVLFEVQEVVLPPTPGALVLAGEADEDLVRDWATAFTIDAGLAQHEVEGAADGAASKLAKGQVYFWQDAGAPKAMVMFGPTAFDGKAGRIMSVYTPPSERRRGYGAAAAAHLAAQLLDGGWRRLVLFADRDNETAMRLYRRIGFRPVANYCNYLFEDA